MKNRGLLSADDRALFAGEKDDVDDEAQAKAKRRYNIRQRIDNIIEDLQLLEEAGEDQLLAEFYQDIEETRIKSTVDATDLEQRLSELEDRFEDARNGEE